MIRKMLGLAWEAAKVELEQWKNPTPAGALIEPVVEDVPAINEVVTVSAPIASAPSANKSATSNKWQSPAFHVETLNSKVCPDCGEPKSVGWYRWSIRSSLWSLEGGFACCLSTGIGRS
jgi:hypothetical protein